MDPHSPNAMTESELIARQRTLLRELLRAAAERGRAAPEAERTYRAEKAAILLEFEESFQTAVVRFASEKEAIEREYEATKAAVQADFEAENEAARREFGAARQKTIPLRD